MTKVDSKLPARQHDDGYLGLQLHVCGGYCEVTEVHKTPLYFAESPGKEYVLSCEGCRHGHGQEGQEESAAHQV